MKVEFKTTDVLPKLTQVASVINAKSNLLVLMSVCITIKGDSVIITASDGETWITERAGIISSEEDCVFCVNAQDILKCLRTLDDVTVTMTFDDEKKILTCDYGKGKMNMPYSVADDFPRPVLNMDEAGELVVASDTVLKAIELTRTAIASDDLRPIMNGIHFDFANGNMMCCSCNFYKMVRFCNEINSELTGNFTLPQKTTSLIQSVLSSFNDDVKIRFTDKAISVSNQNFKITSRLLEGDYPNVNFLVPKETIAKVYVSNDDMVQALKHVLSVYNNGAFVQLTFKDGEIVINAEDFNFSKSATETVPCKYESEDEFSICFNGDMLIDLLKNIDNDTVVFEMIHPEKPAMLYSNGEMNVSQYLSLIMPMKLN